MREGGADLLSGPVYQRALHNQLRVSSQQQKRIDAFLPAAVITTPLLEISKCIQH